MTRTELTGNVRDQLRYAIGMDTAAAGPKDIFRALGLALRRELIDRASETERRRDATTKRVYYLSMEFLVGRSLLNNALNLGVADDCTDAIEAVGGNVDAIAAAEPDAALGNGGLGRLAACFLDSMATLGIAGTGCGIRYDYGLFRQQIINGEQWERPDHWDANGSPWLIERAAEAHHIPLHGHIEHHTEADGTYTPRWMGWRTIVGVPHDMAVVGWNGETVNTLRLYEAKASDHFDMRIFNTGDFVRAVEENVAVETISKVLYPTDAVDQGRELRLIQEYFLVACSLRDALRDFDAQGHPLAALPSRVAIQMNDTHPALAVAELMRILVDERSVQWAKAWELTVGTLAFTNHTLLPEALETWPVDLVARVLPRHLQIIQEINARFLEQVRTRWPDDEDRVARLSIIQDGPDPRVRMANLAIVGSHSVNGVAALHSQLIRSDLVPDFHQLWPERFNNKTNGVTPRRWINQANPGLARLLDEAIGPDWITDLSLLRNLTPLADDTGFVDRIAAIKQANKERATARVADILHRPIDPATMFDVQCKRIHEYKRQLMNVLHLIHLHLLITEDAADITPRTHLFSGKAAPGYDMAKRIIHLINEVGRVVAADRRVRDRLSVVFVPDYRVSVAEWLIPGADVSEQISTAGMEASGTGNMKLTMNGALTVGTWDGATIEMAEQIGADDVYIFGLRAHEIAARRAEGYDPGAVIAGSPMIRRVLDALDSDRYSTGGRFAPIVDSLVQHDHYFVLADFAAYVEAQERLAHDFTDPAAWHARAVRNIAGMGEFSSDRTIAQYAREIWGVMPGSDPAAAPSPSATEEPSCIPS